MKDYDAMTLEELNHEFLLTQAEIKNYYENTLLQVDRGELKVEDKNGNDVTPEYRERVIKALET